MHPLSPRNVLAHRICFRWVGDDAEDVEIVDYHA